MSVAQAASSAQVALSVAMSSPSPSESLAPGSEIDPPAPGPGDSGLAPIDADTYAFDKPVLKLISILSEHSQEYLDTGLAFHHPILPTYTDPTISQPTSP